MSAVWNLVSSVKDNMQDALDSAAGLQSMRAAAASASEGATGVESSVGKTRAPRNGSGVVTDAAEAEANAAVPQEIVRSPGAAAMGPDSLPVHDLPLPRSASQHCEDIKCDTLAVDSPANETDACGDKLSGSPPRSLGRSEDKPAHEELDPAPNGGGGGAASAAATCALSTRPDGAAAASATDDDLLRDHDKGEGDAARGAPSASNISAQLEHALEALSSERRDSLQLTTENQRLASLVNDLESQLAAATATSATSSSASAMAVPLKTAPAPSNREQALIAEGQQLSEQLGKERIRNRQLLEEKRKLDEKVKELLMQLSDYSAKEQQWQSSRSLEHANEEALKVEIRNLEVRLQRQDHELRASCHEAKTLSAELLAQRQQHQAQLEQAESRWEAKGAELEGRCLEAQRERDDAIAAQRRAMIDCERKVALAEREAAEAFQRVHNAEARAFEAVQSVGDATQSLTQQVATAEDLRRAAEVAKANGERHCAALADRLASTESALRAADAEAAAKYAAHNAQLQHLHAELRQAHREREAAQQRAKHLDEALRASLAAKDELAARMRATPRGRTGSASSSTGSSADGRLPSQLDSNSHGDTATQVADGPQAAVVEGDAAQSEEPDRDHSDGSARRRRGGGGTDSVSAPHGMERSGKTPSGPPITLLPGATALPSTVVSSLSSSSRTETQLVHALLELQELRGARAELESSRAKLTTLAHQHDVLLQMYGAQQEALEECREAYQVSRASYQQQLEVLGEEVHVLQQRLLGVASVEGRAQE